MNMRKFILSIFISVLIVITGCNRNDNKTNNNQDSLYLCIYKTELTFDTIEDLQNSHDRKFRLQFYIYSNDTNYINSIVHNWHRFNYVENIETEKIIYSNNFLDNKFIIIYKVRKNKINPNLMIVGNWSRCFEKLTNFQIDSISKIIIDDLKIKFKRQYDNVNDSIEICKCSEDVYVKITEYLDLEFNEFDWIGDHPQ